jgi:hypothetical protein
MTLFEEFERSLANTAEYLQRRTIESFDAAMAILDQIPAETPAPEQEVARNLRRAYTRVYIQKILPVLFADEIRVESSDTWVAAFNTHPTQ